MLKNIESTHCFKIDGEINSILMGMENKSEFIKNAVIEKLKRDGIYPKKIKTSPTREKIVNYLKSKSGWHSPEEIAEKIGVKVQTVKSSLNAIGQVKKMKLNGKNIYSMYSKIK